MKRLAVAGDDLGLAVVGYPLSQDRAYAQPRPGRDPCRQTAVAAGRCVGYPTSALFDRAPVPWHDRQGRYDWLIRPV
jgi:hypothetical protein